MGYEKKITELPEEQKAIVEEQLEQYVNVKYNTKDLWTICENAHPAIITREEYQKAMKRKERISNQKYKPKLENDYLLSGDNANGEYLFTCSNCGGHIEMGLDTEIVIERINELKKQKEELMKEIQKIEEKGQENPKIKREDIQKYFYNFKELFENSTINEKKELLKTIISNITLNEKEHHVEISFYSQWCTALEQVAGLVYYAPPLETLIIELEK